MRDGFDRCLNYYKEMVLALFSAIMSLKMQAQCPNLVFDTRLMQIYIKIFFSEIQRSCLSHLEYSSIKYLVIAHIETHEFKAFLSFQISLSFYLLLRQCTASQHNRKLRLKSIQPLMLKPRLKFLICFLLLYLSIYFC